MLSIQKSTSSIQSSNSYNKDVKLSKKEKKKNLRSQSTEIELDSCSQSETNNDEEKRNEYINIINKKLRTLRKRLNKIEKYEQTDKSLLNNDQISSVEKKPEVIALIREFEEIIKQYVVIDEKEQKEEKLEKKLQEEKVQNEINEKIMEEKKIYSSNLKFLFKTLYALNVVINTRQFTFTNDELNALNFIRSSLIGNNEILDENQIDSEEILEKLINSSEEECCENISYEEVNKLIDLILNPPQVSQEIKNQSLSFFSEVEEKNEFSQPTFIIDSNENDEANENKIENEDKNENGYENETENKINDIAVSFTNISFIPQNEENEEQEEEIATEQQIQYQVEEDQQQQNQEVEEEQLQQQLQQQEIYINENYVNEDYAVTNEQNETIEIKEVINKDDNNIENNNNNNMYYNQMQFIDEQQYENINLIPNESMNMQDQQQQQEQQQQQQQQQQQIPMYQNNQHYPRKRGGYYNNGGRGGRRRGGYSNGQHNNRRGGYSSYRGGSRGGYYQQNGKNNYYKNSYQNQNQTHI